jgi:hypothetical protein
MLVVMPKNTKNSELPQGWEKTEYAYTNRAKLYAVFQHRDSEKEVHIVPYRTFESTSFTDSHRVTIETPESGLEVFAEGLEVEHPTEAQEAAEELMSSI